MQDLFLHFHINLVKTLNENTESFFTKELWQHINRKWAYWLKRRILAQICFKNWLSLIKSLINKFFVNFVISILQTIHESVLNKILDCSLANFHRFNNLRNFFYVLLYLDLAFFFLIQKEYSHSLLYRESIYPFWIVLDMLEGNDDLKILLY